MLQRRVRVRQRNLLHDWLRRGRGTWRRQLPGRGSLLQDGVLYDGRMRGDEGRVVSPAESS